MLAPAGEVMTPAFAVREPIASPSSRAAAFSNCPRATAAATRIGVKVEMVVFEPPVSWLNSSSGRASASVTDIFSSGRSSSSAISIAEDVVMPCPTSARGRAKEAVPSAPIRIVIRFDVGSAAWVSMSLRS